MARTYKSIVARAAAYLNLSERQRQIVELFLAGVSGPDTAAKIGISYDTLKTHVRRLYRRLGVTNRPDLLRVIEVAAEQTQSS